MLIFGPHRCRCCAATPPADGRALATQQRDRSIVNECDHRQKHPATPPAAHMGGSATKLNVLVCGLDGAGKTTMLYHMRLKEARKDFKPTTGLAPPWKLLACPAAAIPLTQAVRARPAARAGFNYEVVPYIYKKKRYDLHMWDLAGEKKVRRAASAHRRCAAAPHDARPEQLRALWSNFYNNMYVDALVFVIDGNNRSKMPEGACTARPRAMLCASHSCRAHSAQRVPALGERDGAAGGIHCGAGECA